MIEEQKHDTIVVLDFGGQYSHLITRRVRECNVYSELLPYNMPAEKILEKDPKGIILSGGPASVYEKDAPVCDPKVFDLKVPVLGICYGLQLMAHMLGGKVSRARKREFGKTELEILDNSDLFFGINRKKIFCWMSHSDIVETLPQGFETIARTENCPHAAVRSKDRKLFGVQFHPEVVHTEFGKQIIENFVIRICKCRPTWKMENFVDEAIRKIRSVIKDDRAICALSGGVDSSTAAVLVHKAIGDRLVCVFINHGLLRKNEPEEVLKIFRDKLKMNVIYVDASERFLKRLKGVTDPEEKRKIIGEEFIKVFTEVAEKVGRPKWLVQGTLYPDVIESARTESPASRIKTHHNVGGLPPWTPFKILEPLRMLYKDEVRKLARVLGLPEEIVKRHPFPGPGLAVRIIGEVTPEKLRICREASYIVEEELKKAGLYDKVWQAFAIVGDDKAVGILGDQRALGHIVIVRIVTSLDGMTADWARIPYEVLERISNRITNEVEGVTWVAYAISSKPPATIEPC
ncbi:MAG: glutamine-hydrolyzing GMP synthase [Candidatus Baldrarchaeia archaeon]